MCPEFAPKRFVFLFQTNWKYRTLDWRPFSGWMGASARSNPAAARRRMSRRKFTWRRRFTPSRWTFGPPGSFLPPWSVGRCHGRWPRQRTIAIAYGKWLHLWEKNNHKEYEYLWSEGKGRRYSSELVYRSIPTILLCFLSVSPRLHGTNCRPNASVSLVLTVFRSMTECKMDRSLDFTQTLKENVSILLFSALLKKMLDPNPDTRATVAQVRANHWFRRGFTDRGTHLFLFLCFVWRNKKSIFLKFVIRNFLCSFLCIFCTFFVHFLYIFCAFFVHFLSNMNFLFEVCNKKFFCAFFEYFWITWIFCLKFVIRNVFCFLFTSPQMVLEYV